MGEGGCCKGQKTIKGAITGIVIAVLIFTILYFSQSNSGLSDGINQLKNFVSQPRPNLTATIEIVPDHPKDIRLRTTQAEIDELLQSVETYKNNLPDNIVSAVKNLVADHQDGIRTPNNSVTRDPIV